MSLEFLVLPDLSCLGFSLLAEEFGRKLILLVVSPPPDADADFGMDSPAFSPNR